MLFEVILDVLVNLKVFSLVGVLIVLWALIGVGILVILLLEILLLVLVIGVRVLAERLLLLYQIALITSWLPVVATILLETLVILKTSLKTSLYLVVLLIIMRLLLQI